MTTIRLAQPEDAAAIVEFNMAMAYETEQKQLDQATLSRGVQAVFDEPARGFYVVADSPEGPVGSLLVTSEWSDWRNGTFWWIQSLYVLPQWRRQGVFKSLYEFVSEKAQQDGNICGLRLYVESNNHTARACYEKRGMTPSIYTFYEEMSKQPKP